MRFPCLATAARLALLVALSAGCAEGRRAAQPSAEYGQARAHWAALLERHRDFGAAALDPAFAQVLALLDAVPQDDLARDFREELRAIHREAVQAQRARAARQEGLRYRPRPPAIAAAPEEDSPAAAASAPPALATERAEALVPVQGMPIAQFKERFGDCFAVASALDVAGLGQGEAWALADSEHCRQRLPGFADKSVLVVGEAIESVRPTASLTVVEKIFFEGREISPEERDCLKENHRRALAGATALDCQAREDPYQAPAQVPATMRLESL